MLLMKILIQPAKVADKVLGAQTICTDSVYRPMRYVQSLSVNGGLLLYHLMTGEVLFLEKSEMSAFSEHLFSDCPPVPQLIEKWFLVPADCDDLKVSQQLSDLMQHINRIDFNLPVHHFTVLPTTDCNARCFYCYELNGKRRNMTEQTARDVADFIARKCNNESVNLRWFGGEPLYNAKAIDIICDSLRARGIPYISRMISNGYLFDDSMVERAVNLWKLSWVQITVDGTEEVYNRIKAFIYKDSNAFVRVTDNIERLLKAGIKVHVRMNMDDHNDEDLYQLADQLQTRFSKYQHFSIYAHLLFEDSCARIANRASETRHELMQKFIKLQNKLIAQKNLRYTPLDRTKVLNHCMADSDSSLMILPDGKIGKCEHYTDDHYIGSIYSDQIDFDVLKWFKTSRYISKDCETCELRPMCSVPICCQSAGNRCDDMDKAMRLQALRYQMQATYDNYVKKNRADSL